MRLPKVTWQRNTNPWLSNMTLFHTSDSLQVILLAILLSALLLLKCRLILGNKEIILNLTHLFSVFLSNNWTIQHKGSCWNPIPITAKAFLGKICSSTSHTHCVYTHYLPFSGWHQLLYQPSKIQVELQQMVSYLWKLNRSNTKGTFFGKSTFLPGEYNTKMSRYQMLWIQR